MMRQFCRFMAIYHGLTAQLLATWAAFKVRRGKWWKSKAED